jgi:hypothetical protein
MLDHFFFVKDNPVSALPHRPTYGSKPKVVECLSLRKNIMYPLLVVLYVDGNGI